MQALLRWLDELAEDLEVVEGQELEEELQRTVETALKVQAQTARNANTVGNRDQSKN